MVTASVAVIVMMMVVGCGTTQLVKDKQRAAASGRPLVIEFHATWCGPCKQFERDVLPDARVQLALSGVEFARYDIDTPAGKTALERYKTGAAVPTFIAVGADDRVFGGIRGSTSAGRFVGFLEWAQLRTADARTLERRLAGDPGPQPRIIAARWYAGRGELDRARSLYDEALAAARGDRRARAAIDWDRVQLDAATGTAEQLARGAAAYVARYPDAPYRLDALEVALLAGGLPAAERTALATGAVVAARQDALLLNNLIYLLLAADELAAARAAAERQVELLADESNPYDSLAEVRHMMGDRAGALAAADEAIRRADDRDKKDYEANRARFARGDGTPSPSVVEHEKKIAALLAGLHIQRRPTPQQQAAFVAAMRQASAAIAARCAAHGAPGTSVVMRLDVDPGGGQIRRVFPVTDAPDPLAQCLVDAAADQTLPPPPPRQRGVVTLPVTF
jgi:thiol-disulfide isomerase/thioredoxin